MKLRYLFTLSLLTLLRAADSSAQQGAFKVHLSAQRAEIPGTHVSEDANDFFTASFQAGTRDSSGHFLGGTELMNIVAYKDWRGVARLYAANGYGLETPGNAGRSAPQLMVLDSPRGRWRQEHAFSELLPNGSQKLRRISALKAITFTSDGHGNSLSHPVSRLLVGLTPTLGYSGAVFVWDDKKDVWTKRQSNHHTFYRDPITGADMVFSGDGDPDTVFTGKKALTARGGGSISSGVYDPSVRGGIRWNARPETTGVTNRIMAFVECDNQLYFASKPAIYQRENGTNPTWRKVYSYSEDSIPKLSSGLRGLTCIADPEGKGEVILAVMEGRGEVLRINPRTGAATTEFRIGPAVRKLWKNDGHAPRFYLAGAYNDMPTVSDPTTHERLHVIGLSFECLSNDLCFPQGKDNSTFYLTRDMRAQYKLFEVKPLPHPTLGSNPRLVAVRAIVESPFPEEAGKILYLGGYDSYNRTSHNTAWIYKVGLTTALSNGISLN